MKKVFLVSLPRSGSTLLQNLLRSDDRILSISENWILLNLLANKETRLSNYGSIAEARAWDEIYQICDENELNKVLNDYIDGIYGALIKSQADIDTKSTIYLDKTPRYFLILNEIYRIIEDKTIILLSRNPIDIINSYQNTFGSKYMFKLPLYVDDLRAGFEKMAQFYAEFGHTDDVIHINYELLIDDFRTHLKSKLKDGNLVSVKSLNSKLINKRSGILGDPLTGKYKNLVQKNTRIELFTYLWYMFNRKMLNVQRYNETFEIKNKHIEIYISYSSLFYLLSYIPVMIIKLFNGKAIYQGFKRKIFYR